MELNELKKKTTIQKVRTKTILFMLISFYLKLF